VPDPFTVTDRLAGIREEARAAMRRVGRSLGFERTERDRARRRLRAQRLAARIEKARGLPQTGEARELGRAAVGDRDRRRIDDGRWRLRLAARDDEQPGCDDTRCSRHRDIAAS